MSARLLRALLPLITATVIGVAAWVVLLNYGSLILWSTAAFVPVFTGSCLWWRQRLVRDEATPPFGLSPAPGPGSSPERAVAGGRRVVAGVVVSSELARLGAEQEG